MRRTGRGSIRKRDREQARHVGEMASNFRKVNQQ